MFKKALKKISREMKKYGSSRKKSGYYRYSSSKRKKRYIYGSSSRRKGHYPYHGSRRYKRRGFFRSSS